MTLQLSKEDIKQNLKVFVEKASLLERENLELKARVADLQQEVDEANDSSIVRQQILQESWRLQAAEYANTVKLRCMEECQRLQRSYETHGASLLSAERILRQNSEHATDVYKAVAQSSKTKSLVTLKDFDIADGHIGIYNHSGTEVSLSGYSVRFSGLRLNNSKRNTKSAIVFEHKHVIAPHSFISVWWDHGSAIATKEDPESIRESPENGSFFVYFTGKAVSATAAFPNNKSNMDAVAHLHGPKDNWLSSIRSNQRMRGASIYNYNAQDDDSIPQGANNVYNYFGDAFVGPEGPLRTGPEEGSLVKVEQTFGKKKSQKLTAAMNQSDYSEEEEDDDDDDYDEEEEDEEQNENGTGSSSASSSRKRKLQGKEDDRASKTNSKNSSSSSSIATLRSDGHAAAATATATATSDTEHFSVPLPLHTGRKAGSLLFTSIKVREIVGGNESFHFQKRAQQRQQQQTLVHSVECTLCNFSDSPVDIGGWVLMCVNESRLAYFAIPPQVVIAPRQHVLLADLPLSLSSSSAEGSSSSATTTNGNTKNTVSCGSSSSSMVGGGFGASFGAVSDKMHSYVTAAAQKARTSHQLKKRDECEYDGRNNSNSNDAGEVTADNSLFSLSLDGRSTPTTTAVIVKSQKSFGVERLFGQHSINAQLSAEHRKSRPKTIVPACTVRLPGLARHCNISGSVLAIYLLKPSNNAKPTPNQVQIVDLTLDDATTNSSSSSSSVNSCFSWLKTPTAVVSVCSAVLPEHRLRAVAEAAISSVGSSNIESLSFVKDGNSASRSSSSYNAAPELRFFGSSSSSSSISRSTNNSNAASGPKGTSSSSSSSSSGRDDDDGGGGKNGSNSNNTAESNCCIS